jgi:hypothetical protein
MKMATLEQINQYAQDNDLEYMYRGTRGLHFWDHQDNSHYIYKDDKIIGGYKNV